MKGRTETAWDTFCQRVQEMDKVQETKEAGGTNRSALIITKCAANARCPKSKTEQQWRDKCLHRWQRMFGSNLAQICSFLTQGQRGCLNLTTYSPNKAQVFIFFGPLGHSWTSQHLMFCILKLSYESLATSGTHSTWSKPKFMNFGSCLAHIALSHFCNWAKSVKSSPDVPAMWKNERSKTRRKTDIQQHIKKEVGRNKRQDIVFHRFWQPEQPKPMWNVFFFPQMGFKPHKEVVSNVI